MSRSVLRRGLSTFPLLHLTRRSGTGSRVTAKCRHAGQIPGTVYGTTDDDNPVPTHVTLDTKTFNRLFRVHGETLENKVFQAQIDNDPPDPNFLILPRQMRFDPVKDTPVHVNYVRFRPGRRVAVPVEYINADASLGLKRGGYVNFIQKTVDCACFDPETIPTSLLVDLTGTRVGDRVRIRDCVIPQAVEPLVSSRDVIVATIAGKRGIQSDDGDDDAAA